MADFERFTSRARKVLTLAQEEAQRFQHNYIGTEHLLLGLIRANGGIAEQVLSELGVELDKTRRAIETIVGQGERAVTGQIGLQPQAKKLIEVAVDEARGLGHHYIGAEHLLLALGSDSEGVAVAILESLGVSLGRVRVAVIEKINQPDYPNDKPEQTRKLAEYLMTKESEAAIPPLLRLVEQVTKWQTNQTSPLIGRERETERILQILMRWHNPHALLVGESGVGKTAIVEGLISQIGPVNALPGLENLNFIRLELSDFVDFVVNSKPRASLAAPPSQLTILFMAQFDRLVEFAKSENCQIAFYDLLSRPELRLVGTTTPAGYERLKEIDSTLAHRFQVVQVDEPSLEATLEILRGLKSNYERHHGVKIEDGALEIAVFLSDKYLSEPRQPTKALSLLDEACSLIALRRATKKTDGPQLEEFQGYTPFENTVTDYNVTEVVAEMVGKTIAEIRKETSGQ